MVVTDFYPVFYANDVDAEVKHYVEDLGFELKHRPQIKFLDYAALENDKGRRVDIVRSDFPADNFSEGFLGMRANVSDYDAGAAYFESQGYTLFGEPHELETFITALFVKGNEHIIMFYHKK